MKPITKLASTTLPDGSILDLWERDGFHFLLRDGVQLASSFSHGSNEAAAAMAAAPVKRANQPAFLLDGLSLGFTLFALMDLVQREKARFIVAEPCKPLVDWHQELMDGERPGFLHDPRVSVEFTPALQIARKNPKSFHAILCRSTHERMNLSVAEASDYFAALKQGGQKSGRCKSCAVHGGRMESGLMRGKGDEAPLLSKNNGVKSGFLSFM